MSSVPAPVSPLRPCGALGDSDPSLEYQPFKVVDEVCHPDFYPGAGDADRSDKEAHPVFLLGEDVLDARANDRFESSLARRTASGIGRPFDFLRWDAADEAVLHHEASLAAER